MHQPQSGVLPNQKSHAIFATYLIQDDAESLDRIRGAAASFPGLCDKIAALDETAGPVATIGFGANAWDTLFRRSRPAELRQFQALEDNGRRAPSTPGDLLLHIRGDRMDLCFELVRRMRERLRNAVTTVEEIHCFRYLDSRDLTGFVDGTENPEFGPHREGVVLLGEEAGEFAGGSYVSLQRYVHNLSLWESLSVADQEAVIARSKTDNVEFESDRKPPTAHIKRVNIKEDGKLLEIMRYSMPYGTANEMGLYFIAYANTADHFDKMLKAMICADAEGHYDHLMNYTQAVTGVNFFVPSRDWLEYKD